MMKYIKLDEKCKCGHSKKAHTISGRRPTKKNPFYASCGSGAYPPSIRYTGKCRFCKCNGFELDTQQPKKNPTRREDDERR